MAALLAHPAIDHAVAGLTAGAMSTIILHPLDLIKTRMQVDGTKFIETIKTLSSVATAAATSSSSSSLSPLNIASASNAKLAEPSAVSTGCKSRMVACRTFYQGLSPNLAGNASSWGLYFLWYTFIKRWMIANKDAGSATINNNLNAGEHLLAAAEAGALTAVMTNPLWVIKTRMCLQDPRDRPYTDAFQVIYRQEGIRGFYKGMIPALFGVSHGAIQFMSYEEMKKFHRQYYKDHTSTAAYIGMAASSKVLATVLTYPYQVVRSRLQDNRQSAKKYQGVVDVTRRLFQESGLRSFYRGLMPNVIRVLPGTCITFAVYETLSGWMKQQAVSMEPIESSE